ncbi:MAG: hypothetical protein ACO2ZP_04990 [Bacteriovoracaceae bacterium]
MASEGFIKLHRRIQGWGWYRKPTTFKLFIHLLLEAEWGESKRFGVPVKRGQLLTGRNELASQCGLTVQEVRTSLQRLKSTNEITIKSTSKYSIITIQNYESYQDFGYGQPAKQPANTPTNNQQTTNKQPLSKKTRKQENKNIYTSSFASLVEVWNTLNIKQHNLESKLMAKAFKRYQTRKKDYSDEEIVQATRNYARVLSESDFFKYRWDLDQFLTREGALAFFPDRFTPENYQLTESAETWIPPEEREGA